MLQVLDPRRRVDMGAMEEDEEDLPGGGHKDQVRPMIQSSTDTFTQGSSTDTCTSYLPSNSRLLQVVTGPGKSQTGWLTSKSVACDSLCRTVAWGTRRRTPFRGGTEQW